jgi:uncharacterized protein (DUF1778 family)
MSNNSTAGQAQVVRFRISEQERQALEKNAQARGTSVSNYLRSAFPELNERKYPSKAKKET